MSNSSSYQLVSEHSILSAQTMIGHAAMAIETEGSTTRFATEWEEQLEEIKQHWGRRTKGNGRRSRRDHAPCRRRVRRDEFSEKLHAIYLDLKLQMLQQFYVKAKSRQSKNSERIARETEESEKEEGTRCSSGFPLSVTAKSEGAEWNGNDQEPLLETPDAEALTTHEGPEEVTLEESSPKKKMTPEDSPATATEGDATLTEAWPANRSVSLFLSFSIKGCDAQSSGEEEAQPEEAKLEALSEESPPEKEDGGTTMEAVEIVGDARKQSLSLVTESCDVFGNERNAGADWLSWKLGCVTELMNQAQALILTPPQFTNNRVVFLIKREMAQKENLTFLSRTEGFDKTMGPPNTLLTGENKAFDPGGGFSIFGIARSSCFKLWDPCGRLLIVCFWHLHLEDKVNV